MLHGHYLNHVQIGLHGRPVDRKHRINDIGGKLFGKGSVQLGGE